MVGERGTNVSPTNPNGITYDANGNVVSGSGSGSSSGPTDKEKKAKDRLNEIAGRNQAALNDKFTHGMRTYDISDEQANKLWEAQTRQNKMNTGDDWFTQRKKLQASANALKDAGGDSFKGSNLYSTIDLLKSADNDINNEALVNERKNQNTIDKDLFESLSQSVNGRNELAADTEYQHRSIANDFLAQLVNINPELADGDPMWNDWSHAGDGFFDGNVRGAAPIKEQGLYREDNAGANAANLWQNHPDVNKAAANQSYWDKMLNGYNRRA